MTLPIIPPSELLKLSQTTNQAGGVFLSDEYEQLMDNIKTNSELGLFTAHIAMTIENVKPGPEVFVLHQEFRNRGFRTFFTTTDNTNAVFSVSWSHPDFTEFERKSKGVWSFDMIQSALDAKNFHAYELYLSQLCGNDLRHHHYLSTMKDIEIKLRNKIVASGVKDYTDPDDSVLKYHLNYFGPDSCFSKVMQSAQGSGYPLVSASSLSSLFDRVKSSLEDNGYKVVVTEEVDNYFWTIVWNDPPPPDPEP